MGIPGRPPHRAARPAAALLAALVATSCASLPDPETPADYLITIHGAVVLPFKPVDRTTWDGTGPDPLPEAGGFLAALAQWIHAGGSAMVRAAEMVARWAQAGIEAPDCYPEVVLEGKTWGGPELADQDDFLPAWDLRIPIRGSTSDDRVLSIRVRDADLSDDDNVGAWETTVGELLAYPGVREIAFVDREGRTEAGGIVALRISVERTER